MGKWGYIHHGFQREVTGDGGMGFLNNQENQSTVLETSQCSQMEEFNDYFGKDKVKVPNRSEQVFVFSLDFGRCARGYDTFPVDPVFYIQCFSSDAAFSRKGLHEKWWRSQNFTERLHVASTKAPYY